MARRAPWISVASCALALCALACGDGAGHSAADASVADEILDAAPTAGCGASAAATGVFEATLMVSGQQRSYLLAVPEDYDSALAYPVVFGFHGRGSDSEQARSYFGVEEAAGGSAIAVYPQGLGQNGLATDTSWNIAQDSYDLAFFDQLLDALGAAYCVDRARVFATGHSAGGFMANHLACHRSAALRAIAPVAGGGPLRPECDGGSVAAMLIHGTFDVIVLPSVGERSRDYWIDANRCVQTRAAVQPAPCESYRGCLGAPLHWCFHSETALSGHGWPSFAPRGIWSFFAQF